MADEDLVLALDEGDMFKVDDNYYKKPRPTRIETFDIEGTDFQVKVSLIGKIIMISDVF